MSCDKEEAPIGPTADFAYTANYLIVSFIDSSIAGDGTINRWTWDFGDGETSDQQNPTHPYTSAATYTVRLTVIDMNDLTAYKEDGVIVEEYTEAGPAASFSYSTNFLEVSFTDISVEGDGVIDTWGWDFGDGSSSSQKNPTYTYRQPGIFNVSLKAIGDGGEDIEVKNNYVEVYRRANANFTINKGPDEKIFIPNDPLVTINYSINADSYLWDFGDGNTSTERNPTHYYTKEGTFPIFLIAETSFGCNDTFDLGRTVIAELQGSIRVPNAFTPNPSGPGTGQVKRNPGFGELNDVFYALIVGAETYELNIFNKVPIDPRTN